MIIGQQVTLLPFDEIYLPLVHGWVNQPDVRRGTGTEGPVSSFEHRRWYEALMADCTNRVFVIAEGRGPTATPVGLLGLKNINTRSRHAEFWIYIGEAGARRKGLAREATVLILDHGFGMLALHRIFLWVIGSNAAAVNLYGKLGFVQDGIGREHLFLEGRFQDMLYFSVLEVEFRALQKSWATELHG
jgi:diamine N-acetyltransferase